MPKIPAGYEVGRARRDELSRLAAIEIAAAEIFPLEDLSPQARAEADPPSFFDEAHSAGRLWVARSLNPRAPVGFAAAVVRDGSAHLQEMDVLPDHGRQGLGRALVLQVARWARSAGFESLTLTTFRHLPWNAPFYASLGFLEILDSDLTPQLRAALTNEAAEGLDPRKRVAMRLKLNAKIVSINVGRPRAVAWRGQSVRTSIFKDPVSGPVRVGKLNLAGDQQADLSVHGGADKAVYAYPSEHYAYWHDQLPEMALPWGAFGENLTTEGLSEDSVRIGDRLRVGLVEFLVTQPRVPCFKLGVRFERPDMVKKFQRSGRPGYYLAVLREGQISVGDPIQMLSDSQAGVTVGDIARLYTAGDHEQELLRRASELAALPEGWREHFRSRLRNFDS